MAASPDTKQARLRRAFTLVEVMVAMSVLAILVLSYVTLFNQASQAWISGSGNTERRRNSRSLTDYISVELRGAMLPVERLTANGKGNLQLMVNPPGSQVPDKYRFADAIFWQAPLATESTYGDLAEVGYFVKWDETNANDPRPMLCRFFVNPSTTDSSGTIAPDANFLIYNNDPKKWLSGNLIEAVAPATKAAGYTGLFGENVVGLWIRSYGLDGQELPRSFDSRTGYDCKFQTTDSTGAKQTWTEKRYLPAKIRVSIAQIDSHNAPRLGAAASQVKDITSTQSIRDASEFLDELRSRAAGSPVLRALLPGIRIYSTEVQLQNSR